MWWLARLALIVGALAIGFGSVPGAPYTVGAAFAESSKAKADTSGRAESRGRDRSSDKQSAKSGKSGKSGGGKAAGKTRGKGNDDKPGRNGGKRPGKPRSVSVDRGGSGDPGNPVEVDDPTPAPVEPEVPVKVDDPTPAPVEPEIPVKVDDPTPAPVEPEVPVKVDDPSPAPVEPEVPVKVDDPTPAPVEPERPVKVEDPTPSVQPGEVGPVEAVGPDPEPKRRVKRLKSKDKPSLQALIDGVLGRDASPARDDRKQAVGAAKPAPAAPVVAAPAEPEKAAVADVPEAAADVAATPAAEPVEAARAPRIALSSGSGGASYRQHEISVLGLTPRSRQVVGALGCRILSERRSPLLGDRIVARLRTPGNQSPATAIARVRAALPDLVVDYAHLYRPSGGSVPVRYGADMVGAPAPGACRIDARIGLIDSGVGEHPSLARADITRRNFVERNAATNVAHGTAIASMLVGELPGSGPLAPGARVFSANVFTRDAGGLRADAHAIIEALDWMASQRVPVINLSLMGPPNALLEEAVSAAARRGQILVAAAGNDGPSAAPAYPAAYPAVIAVAAVDARGRPYGRNNRGAYVYVSAPGVDVWGADARGGEAFWTGTSFAAPFVTATLARDSALGRARDINDSRARIAASARDLGAPGRDPIYGYGLLQSGGCSGTSVALSSKG